MNEQYENEMEKYELNKEIINFQDKTNLEGK
jgi:hypothetical protein